MNYLKTLSILCSSLFLFGCTREIPFSQPEQDSLSFSAQPVQSPSDSVSPSVSSQPPLKTLLMLKMVLFPKCWKMDGIIPLLNGCMAG